MLQNIARGLLSRTGDEVVERARMRELLAAQAASEQLLQSQQELLNRQAVTVGALEARLVHLESRPDEEALRNVIRYAMKAHWRTVDLIEQVAGGGTPAACPLCGYHDHGAGFRILESECVFLGGKLTRHVCPACDVIFGPQKMFALDAEMLDLDYRNLYRVYSEGDSTESIIRAFHLLQPAKGGAYLDFGSGGEWSDAIRRLRGEGWNIVGFEPSATHSSEHVFSTWAEVEQLQFDGILSHNVLEHLFDPVGTTRRLSKLLVPGGRLVHATPCFDYKYEYTHYHVFFFPSRSPAILAARAGMLVDEWVRDGDFIACVLKSDAQAQQASV